MKSIFTPISALILARWVGAQTPAITTPPAAATSSLNCMGVENPKFYVGSILICSCDNGAYYQTGVNGACPNYATETTSFTPITNSQWPSTYTPTPDNPPIISTQPGPTPSSTQPAPTSSSAAAAAGAGSGGGGNGGGGGGGGGGGPPPPGPSGPPGGGGGGGGGGPPPPGPGGPPGGGGAGGNNGEDNKPTTSPTTTATSSSSSSSSEAACSATPGPIDTSDETDGWDSNPPLDTVSGDFTAYPAATNAAR